VDSRPDVSIVVVIYEMARELPRTLMSLSAPLQRAPEGLTWEIIVVDNGSASPPTREALPADLAPLTLVRNPDPAPSPARAVNLGLSLARGGLVGVWIDGARMASPGLVAACAAASRLHERAVVATLNRQLGPALQRISVRDGYDQAAEDALLAGIGWPSDGDRLFEISAPEAVGPTAPLLESNGLFLSSGLWRELGGYDEAFTSPGGGVVNPDTFVRACSLPGVQLIRVLGEATFHQFHGGLTTSSQVQAAEVLKGASREYLRLRGRPLAPVREVGWLYDARTGEVVSG
jgi:hypothetical protein